MNTSKIRKDFPILKRRIKGKPFIYFDNAASTQKPRVVIEAIKNHLEKHNANVHRGIYTVSEEASESFERAREKAKDFIGTKSEKEIIFTRNATEAINLVAFSYGRQLKREDVILTTIAEHHSNFVPWMRLKKEKGVKLEIVKITPDGLLDMRDFKKKLTRKVKLVAIAHASNVLGTIHPVNEIVKMAHKVEAKVLIDGAQSAPHLSINVSKMNCDFFALSGHKMLAPSGIGVLYAKEQLLERMEPFLSGGDMIKMVTTKSVEYNDLPWKFEAGTPFIEGAVGLGVAVDYLLKIGMGKVRNHEIELTDYALKKLQNLGFVTIYGPKDARKKTGAIAFNVKGVHAHDLASCLDEYGIAIRAGSHCTHPLHQYLKVPATARASFYIYNTKKEIDVFIQALKEIHKMFK